MLSEKDAISRWNLNIFSCYRSTSAESSRTSSPSSRRSNSPFPALSALSLEETDSSPSFAQVNTMSESLYFVVRCEGVSVNPQGSSRKEDNSLIMCIIPFLYCYKFCIQFLKEWPWGPNIAFFVSCLKLFPFYSSRTLSFTINHCSQIQLTSSVCML